MLFPSGRGGADRLRVLLELVAAEELMARHEITSSLSSSAGSGVEQSNKFAQALAAGMAEENPSAFSEGLLCVNK